MAEFRAMKRRPVIINTARGGLATEADAVTALEQGLIGGIGFDLPTTKPPRPDTPILRGAGRPDAIVPPHGARAGAQAMRTAWNQVVEGIDSFIAGAPVVKPEQKIAKVAKNIKRTNLIAALAATAAISGAAMADEVLFPHDAPRHAAAEAWGEIYAVCTRRADSVNVARSASMGAEIGMLA